MTVCKFWRQGYCRFGDQCKFEHPPDLGPSKSNQSQSRNQNQNQNQNQFQQNRSQNQNQFQQNQGSNQNQNRFGALQNGGNNFSSSSSSARSNQSNTTRGSPSYVNSKDPRRSRDPKDRPYGLTPEIIADDMKIERPQWIMSAYGPGKDSPVQLFEGLPLEQSFEEVRVQHYLALAAGTPQQSAQLEQELAAQSNQRVQSVLNDVEGALQYLTKGMDTHPNRLDIIAEVARNAKATQQGFGEIFARSNARQPPREPSGFGNNQQQPGFGAHPFQQGSGPQNTATAFGQPSLLGQNGGFGSNQASGTGNTGFGNAQPRQTQTTFGQPSQFGHQLTQMGQSSQFGQPTQMGQPSQFGQPTQMGQPSSFGQPTQQPSTFGQPPNNGLGSFGALAQPQQPTSTFGQPAQQPQNGVFGGAPQQTMNQPFAQPAPMQNGNGGFGGAAPPQGTSGFGQPATITNGGGGFGTQTQQPPNSTYGQPPQSTSNNAFATTTPTPTTTATQPFQIQAPQQQPPQFQPTTTHTPNGTHPNNHTAAPPPPHPDLSTYTTRDPNNKLLTWKGAPVSYIDNGIPCYRKPDGSWERIWFPDGPPAVGNGIGGGGAGGRSGSGEGEAMTQEVREAYEYLRVNGRFMGGVMPEVPPEVEMVRWDV